MKVALYQMNIIWEDKKENLNKVKNVLESLSDKSVDMLLLPEMSLTGFSMNTGLTGESDYYTVNQVKQLAMDCDIAVGVGWTKMFNEKDGDTFLCENHYSILGPDKVENMDDSPIDVPMLFDYAKIHPFSYSDEDKYFKGGDYQDFLYYKDFNISAAICYDLRFPEIFQTMSKRAELIIVPANWPASRIGHWDKLLFARAIENQCYVAGINCVGNIGEVDYCGGTMLVNPYGDTVIPDEIEGYDNGELVLIYEIDNDVDEIRKAFPMKKDRREKLYKSLMSE